VTATDAGPTNHRSCLIKRKNNLKKSTENFAADARDLTSEENFTNRQNVTDRRSEIFRRRWEMVVGWSISRTVVADAAEKRIMSELNEFFLLPGTSGACSYIAMSWQIEHGNCLELTRQ
jgi:hypothetical protein